MYYAFYRMFSRANQHQRTDQRRKHAREYERVKQYMAVRRSAWLKQFYRDHPEVIESRRQRMIEFNKTWKPTPEQQAYRISRMQEGLTPEVQKRAGLTRRGMIRGPMSEDQKQRISQTKKASGWKPSPEQRIIMLKAITDRPQTDHQKRRVTETMSKTWLITDPEGRTQIITNLNEFCRQQKLNRSSMGNIIFGRIKSYRGWKVSEAPKPTKNAAE